MSLKDFLVAMLPFIIVPPALIYIWAKRQQRLHPPTQEQRDAAKVLIDPRWLRSGWVAWIFEFVYLGAYSARRFVAMPAALKAALLIPPILVFAWFSYVFLRESRSGDEFERRVQGVAAAKALWMFMFWSAAMWVQDEIWPSPHHGNPFSAALGVLPLMYGFGMFVAKGSYVPTWKDQR